MRVEKAQIMIEVAGVVVSLTKTEAHKLIQESVDVSNKAFTFHKLIHSIKVQLGETTDHNRVYDAD